MQCLFALILAFIPITAGCLPLPIPNERVERFAIESRVFDAQTQQPIAGAQVSDADDAKQHATSDPSGHFRLPEVRIFHFGYLVGVISYPIWPFTGDMFAPQRTFRVTAPGYEARTLTATGMTRSGNTGDDELPARWLQDTLHVDRVILRHLAF